MLALGRLWQADLGVGFSLSPSLSLYIYTYNRFSNVRFRWCELEITGVAPLPLCGYNV